MVKSDEDRFRAADSDGDGRLNVQEFSAYLHPYDYEYMHDIELDRVMQDYDMNKDGDISLNEYSRRSLGL
jgi:Ca2+-binding EF-hand superfamily protein